MSVGQFSYLGSRVPFEEGDSILLALTRAGVHPTGGGCLCFGGDCPHCLCTVDGVSYVRTCQVPAAEQQDVTPHPVDGGEPPLPTGGGPAATPVEYRHVDVVIVGGGATGRRSELAALARNKTVALFDAGRGEEVIGIYPGPLVVIRTAAGMLHIGCHEVVVATGASEIQPACPGNDLGGIVTARAAELLHEAGVDLGRSIAIGSPPHGVPYTPVEGRLVRFEGVDRVEAVIVEVNGDEVRHLCETAIVGLGLYPRDGLARMGNGLPVSAVGEASREPAIPPPPQSGTVCPCSRVTVGDLQSVWDRGFHELELVKRATLAGTGTCQGAACLPHIRSFLNDRGAELPAPFTARPVSRQLTLGEVAAGNYHPAFPRTALDSVHRDMGAEMDRIGGWWRPWTYGDLRAEYEAVRQRVSIGDVSTLGKMRVTGPDAEAFLQLIYPTDVASIRPGRSRYVLMLNERGYIFDDGLVSRELDNTFSLTFTSGGASHSEMWMRDWGSSYDVRIYNQTMSLGAVNVTGPLASELLRRAGADELPPYMGHARRVVAGVPCKVFRLSFTGEVSFELHHPVDRSVQLWEALMELGADMGIVPHGLQALELLRLEKGHILVGLDTDYDSTPRRIHHEWAVNMAKGDFLGRASLMRTDEIPLDRMLVGMEMQRQPVDGASLHVGGDYVGYVTSSGWSWALDKAVMLAQLHLVDGDLPREVVVEGMVARRVALPFYDSKGERARA